MNKLLRKAAVFTLITCLFSCNNSTEKKIEQLEKVMTKIEKNTVNSEPVFKLYNTSNLWNYLKLDTRNGKISIVQFSVNDKSKQFEYTLSDQALSDNTIPGRFVLHPTNNIYNFLMLDQVSGQTYQVQWSFDEDKRFVIPIY